jgi:hypothetical protein
MLQRYILLDQTGIFPSVHLVEDNDPSGAVHIHFINEINDVEIEQANAPSGNVIVYELHGNDLTLRESFNVTIGDDETPELDP